MQNRNNVSRYKKQALSNAIIRSGNVLKKTQRSPSLTGSMSMNMTKSLPQTAPPTTRPIGMTKSLPQTAPPTTRPIGMTKSLSKSKSKRKRTSTSTKSRLKKAKAQQLDFMHQSNIINKLLANQETIKEVRSNIFDDSWIIHTPKKSSNVVSFFEQMALRKGSQLVEIKNDVYKSSRKDNPKHKYPFYEFAMIKSVHKLINYNKIKINACEKDFSLKIIGVRGNNRKLITDIDALHTVFEAKTTPDQIRTNNLGCRVMLYKKDDVKLQGEKATLAAHNRSGMHPSDVFVQLSRLFTTLLFENKTQNLLFHYKDFHCNKFFTNNTIVPSLSKCKTRSGVVGRRLCSFRALYKQRLLENRATVCIQELGSMNMHEWIQQEGPSLLEWKSVLFQLLHALIVLQKSIDGFMHNGLSTKHIIMCKCQKGGVFIYKIKGKKYYVNNVGWVPKIIPCEFSHVPGVFDNNRVFDPTIQVNLGISDTIDYTYDVHYLMNLVFSYDETKEEVKSWCLKNYGIQYLTDKSMVVNNYRKRYNAQHQNMKTPQMLLKSSFFKTFKSSSKEIKLYPMFSV